MEKENDRVQDLTDSQLLREELLNLEDVDALLEQVMKEAEELKPIAPDSSFEDEELQKMDAIMESASKGVPLDDEILSMLQGLDEEDRGTGFADSVRAEAEKVEAANHAQDVQDWADAEQPLFDEELPDVAEDTTKKEKIKKPKKEKKKKEKKEKTEKKSFWARIMAFVFEPEEEENPESAESNESNEGNVDGERQPKPVKKGKKEKKKKGKEKEEKTKVSADDNASIEAQLSAEDKKNAAKKKKEKPKKEKKQNQKAEKPEEEKGKSRIVAKGIFATLLVCFSLLVMILAVCYALPSYLSLQAARKAFYEQDYKEALHRFYGHELNSSDEILYKKTLVLNTISLSYEQYEIYAAQGRKTEAIHALFEGYKVCRKNKVQAAQYGITEEWDLYRSQFLAVLENEFRVSETEAEKICSMKPLEYTIAVDNLADGLLYDAVTLDMLLGDGPAVGQTENAPGTNDDSEGGLEDLLPEEKELLKKLEEEQKKQQEEGYDEGIPLYEGEVIESEVIFY